MSAGFMDWPCLNITIIAGASYVWAELTPWLPMRVSFVSHIALVRQLWRWRFGSATGTLVTGLQKNCLIIICSREMPLHYKPQPAGLASIPREVPLNQGSLCMLFCSSQGSFMLPYCERHNPETIFAMSIGLKCSNPRSLTQLCLQCGPGLLQQVSHKLCDSL